MVKINERRWILVNEKTGEVYCLFAQPKCSRDHAMLFTSEDEAKREAGFMGNRGLDMKAVEIRLLETEYGMRP